MLRDLLRFELRFHIRQPSFAAACFFFFVLGFALIATRFGPDELALNSPYLISQSLGFISLFAVFAVAIFSSHALLRDEDSGMQEIVFTTPIGRFHYLFSRFLGSFAAGLVVLSLSVVGMIVALIMPWQDPERIASFDLRPYLYALATIAIPNLLFINAVIFATAARTRSALATYVASVFIYVLYFVGAAMTNSPLMAASVPGKVGGGVAALLDPFALSSFFHDTRYWTVAEKNVRLIPLAGTFLLNRLLWIAAAAAIWAVVHRTFSFRLIARSKKRESDLECGGHAAALITVERTKSGGMAAALQMWLVQSRSEIRALLRNGPTIVLLLLWAALAAAEIYSEVLEVEYGSALYPATSLILAALATPLSIIATIVIIYFSAEAFWRERQHRIASILDATPVSGSVMVAAKWTGLVALMSSFAAVGIFVGVVIQVSRGYTHFEPLVYASIFYFNILPLALFAAAAVLIHALSPGKYVGMMLVLLFMVFTSRAQLLGLRHHLWRYATAPAVNRTGMNGLGDYATPFHWYMLLWGTVALMFLLAASLLWRAVGRRWRRAWPSFAALSVIAVATGTWIFYNTTVLNAFTSTDELFDWKAAYEKKYRHIEAEPQPEISAIETNVDLYPAERRYRLSGRHQLTNRSSVPIRSIHVAVRRQARDVALAIPSARLTSRDEQFGMFNFQLDQPLLPGGHTELQYELSFVNEGFVDGEPENSIVENGSFILSTAFPSIGYRKSYELPDRRERGKRGLPDAAKDPEAVPGHTTDLPTNRIDFAATISTASDQAAVTSGTLQRSWLRNGRRYFAYRSASPILNQFAITSARYQKVNRRQGNVDVALYHDARHGANAARILDITAQSLDYLEKNIGPYPERQLHMVEVPSYWGFGGFAMPGMILLNENRVMLIDDRNSDRPDLLLRRVAHEVAHQWFGHQVAPADADGGLALVESLTKYCELMILERLRGREQVQRLLGMELDRYLKGRAGDANKETPLYRVGDKQPYLYYSKGSLIMYAIREMIGEETVNRALRGLMKEKGPTSLDLLEQLREVSSPEHYALIEEWFKEIVLYDLQVADTRVQNRADGRYDVVIRVSAAKTRGDGAGNEHPVAMSEAIEVGAFTSHPEDGLDHALYLQQHQLHEGANDITIIVDKPPAFVAVDPRVLRIDKNRFDNVKKL